jgi:hypothetical protein
MHRKHYATVLDPIKEEYGTVMSALCFIPECFGELFYSAAVMGVLGESEEFRKTFEGKSVKFMHCIWAEL